MPLPGFCISVTGCGSIIKKKLQLYGARKAAVQLFFTPDPDTGSDLCILPVHMLHTVFSAGGSSRLLLPPLIAYGPARHMDAAMTAGCADYLCEPWTPAEFFRRAFNVQISNRVRIDGFSLICRGDRILRCFDDSGMETGTEYLTGSEYALYRLFSRHRGQYFSRSAIAAVLGRKLPAGSRMVDMHVSRLRRRIDDLLNDSGAAGRCPIRTVSGRGWGINRG